MIRSSTTPLGRVAVFSLYLQRACCPEAAGIGLEDADGHSVGESARRRGGRMGRRLMRAGRPESLMQLTSESRIELSGPSCLNYARFGLSTKLRAPALHRHVGWSCLAMDSIARPLRPLYLAPLRREGPPPAACPLATAAPSMAGLVRALKDQPAISRLGNSSSGRSFSL
jgi:hypothetical protein